MANRADHPGAAAAAGAATAAESRAGSSEVAATASQRRRLFIIGPWQDLALFVGTPLLILPAFALAKMRLTIADISLYVAAFGALGHHLPGMMRAYGDTALFRRFRLRFVFAPVFLGVACAASAREDLTVLTLVAILWGVWHGLMQTYGFLRIYDSKAGSFAAWTRRLDLATVIAWFGAGLFLSPYGFYQLLEKYYVRCAGPLPVAIPLEAFQSAWWYFTAAITAVYLLYHAFLLLTRRPVNPIKLVLMTTSCGFWWYARVTIPNPLIGIALFEVFHDVQYLTIVWLFNSNRATRDPSVGSFTRFLFRRSGALIGVYVALVFSYGMLGLAARGFSLATVNHAFQGLLVASGLLHFYYDGFIWKIREKQTSESLGLANQGRQAGLAFAPLWLRHLGKWCLVLVPALLLIRSETAARSTRNDRVAALAARLPHSADAQFKYGEALVAEDRPDEALEQYQRAVELDPHHIQANNNAGILLAQLHRNEEAKAMFGRALQEDPANPDARANLGVLLEAEGDIEAAAQQYRLALERNPAHAQARDSLAALDSTSAAMDANERGIRLAEAGRPMEAITAFQEAVRLAPHFTEAWSNLATAIAFHGDPADAVQAYQEALRLNPDSIETRIRYAGVLASLNRLEEARAQCESVIEKDAEYAAAYKLLGLIFEAGGDKPSAIQKMRQAVTFAPEDEEAKAHLSRLTGPN